MKVFTHGRNKYLPNGRRIMRSQPNIKGRKGHLAICYDGDYYFTCTVCDKSYMHNIRKFDTLEAAVQRFDKIVNS